MQILVYDAHSYDREFLEAASGGRYSLSYTTAQLDEQTTALAQGVPAICCFVNDDGSEPVLHQLAEGGTRLLTLRSTGFNNIDLNVPD
jgi:D-lactate dehydrogenase